MDSGWRQHLTLACSAVSPFYFFDGFIEMSKCPEFVVVTLPSNQDLCLTLPPIGGEPGVR
jgi:hypothetical protein